MTDRNQRSGRKLIGYGIAAMLAIGGLLFAGLQAFGSDEETDPAVAENQADSDGKDKDGNDSEDGEKEKDPIPVEAVAAERGAVSAYISTTANLVALNDVKVPAEAVGTVVEIHVEEGAWVEKGQELATLDREDAELAVGKARAKANNAQMAFARAESMRKKQVISSEDHDRLSMEHGVAEQEVAEFEWALRKRTIRAPFSGRITERFVMTGQRVKPNDELFSIADYNPLVARIYLPEKDILALDTGREVTLALNADESIQFPGRIRLISPIVDTATGTVKVTVEAVDPPKQVRPGGFVTVNIVRERREMVVRLPREAVIRELQSAHVFVADGETATKRSIVTGLEEGGYVEVVSGLEAGERVVTAGQGGLREGSKIKVLDHDADGQVAALDDSNDAAG